MDRTAGKGTARKKRNVKGKARKIPKKCKRWPVDRTAGKAKEGKISKKRKSDQYRTKG